MVARFEVWVYPDDLDGFLHSGFEDYGAAIHAMDQASPRATVTDTAYGALTRISGLGRTVALNWDGRRQITLPSHRSERP